MTSFILSRKCFFLSPFYAFHSHEISSLMHTESQNPSFMAETAWHHFFKKKEIDRSLFNGDLLLGDGKEN